MVPVKGYSHHFGWLLETELHADAHSTFVPQTCSRSPGHIPDAAILLVHVIQSQPEAGCPRVRGVSGPVGKVLVPVEHCAGLVGGLGEQLIVINDLGSVEPRSARYGVLCLFTDGKVLQERSLIVLRAEMESGNQAQRIRTQMQRMP